MKNQLALLEASGTGAEISDCGLYRYRLWREWGPGPSVLWIMLNPSTADAEQDDPTIRRCRAFSKNWGCGRMEIVNLFALRAACPRDLLKSPDPVGPRNDEVLIRAALHDHAERLTVAAWGVFGNIHDRAQEVLDLLSVAPMYCLGHTRDGYPKHPLYVAGETRLRSLTA